jgi:hypothetical protein
LTLAVAALALVICVPQLFEKRQNAADFAGSLAIMRTNDAYKAELKVFDVV